MPFKGDMRLGGPHDNEANLNGTSSDFDGVPAAGTLLSGPSTRDVYITIQETGEVTGNGTENYSVYADGVGGTYEVTNYYYPPTAWTRLGTSEWDSQVLFSDYLLNGETLVSYQNGKTQVRWAYADGNGGYYPEPVTLGNFFSPATRVSGAPFSIINYEMVGHQETGTSYQTGRYVGDSLAWGDTQSGYADGSIYMTYGGQFVEGSYYPNGTFVADADDSYQEVPSGSGNYYHDGNDNRWEWDGSGSIVFRYSGLHPQGTFITNYGDYNYYWNGDGTFYQGEYTGSGNSGGDSGGGSSTPQSGTPTYNTTSGTNYININGSDYPNGTYTGEEYYDGTDNAGSYGTYWSYNYQYEQYGYTFTSSSFYDESIMSWQNVYYKSNGTGGYYEEVNA